MTSRYRFRTYLFFPDVHRFSNPPLVHSVAFFVDHFGIFAVYDCD